MDSKLLTYAELGDALGITAASAKRLANRRKWPKRQGNDGLARVIVPAERLNVSKPVPGDDPGDDAGDDPGAVSGDVSRDDPGAVTGDARMLIDMLQSRIAELDGDLRQARAMVAELTAKAGRVDVVEALLQLERERLAEMRHDRERWHQAATERRRAWWPFRRSA